MNKLVKMTTNNQVAIPTTICKRLKIHKGAYLEAKERGYQIVLTPVRIVDEESYKTYERFIREGRRQVKEGKFSSWEDVKKRLGASGQKSKR